MPRQQFFPTLGRRLRNQQRKCDQLPRLDFCGLAHHVERNRDMRRPRSPRVHAHILDTLSEILADHQAVNAATAVACP